VAANLLERWPAARSVTFRIGVALALLVYVRLAGGAQLLRSDVTSKLGLLIGAVEANEHPEIGIILDDSTVLELPPTPAASLRLDVEVEAAHPREITLTCPDGTERRISLAAHEPVKAGCEWRTEAGGRIEFARTGGRGQVIARDLTLEASGVRLGPDDIPWLTSLAILGWWLAGAVGGRHRWVDATGIFLLSAGAICLAPRIELLRVLSVLLLPLAILQASRVVALRSGYWSAGLVTLAVLAKLVFALSGYGGGDTSFHVHKLNAFAQGEVQTRSVAPGLESPLPVPYPPGIYALLSPFAGLADDRRGPLVIGVALWAGEVLSLLLIMAIARKAGLSSSAALTASALYAALPEGVLVMFKGILANIYAQAGALLTFLCLIPPVSAVGLSFAMAVTFLTHLGVTLNLLVFLGVWTCLAPAAERRIIAASFVPAALVTWALYYRDASGVAIEAVQRVSGNLFRPATVVSQAPAIRAGKIIQNLLLKLGGLPLLALTSRVPLPESSRRLFRTAFYTYLIGAALAIGSPVTIRFELFSAPVFCLFAAAVLEDSQARRVTALIAVFSAVLFGLLFSGRFDMINAILESPRWPLVQELISPVP
jgi:hypothetical protein